MATASAASRSRTSETSALDDCMPEMICTRTTGSIDSDEELSSRSSALASANVEHASSETDAAIERRRRTCGAILLMSALGLRTSDIRRQSCLVSIGKALLMTKETHALWHIRERCTGVILPTTGNTGSGALSDRLDQQPVKNSLKMKPTAPAKPRVARVSIPMERLVAQTMASIPVLPVPPMFRDLVPSAPTSAARVPAQINKRFLASTISSTETHNRHNREDQMWRERELERRLDEARSRSRVTHPTHPERAPSALSSDSVATERAFWATQKHRAALGLEPLAPLAPASSEAMPRRGAPRELPLIYDAPVADAALPLGGAGDATEPGDKKDRHRSRRHHRSHRRHRRHSSRSRSRSRSHSSAPSDGSSSVDCSASRRHKHRRRVSPSPAAERITN